MTLRKKTVLSIAATLVVLFGFLLVSVRAILLNSYARLEETDARQSVNRVENSLTNEIREINMMVGDWAMWDDAYRFVQDRNTVFRQENMTEAIFDNLGLNLILFADNTSRVVEIQAFDSRLGSMAAVPDGIYRYIYPGSMLTSHSSVDSNVSGFILLDGKPMLVASQPVLKGTGEGPIQGSVLMGRYLDDLVIQEIADETQLHPTLISLDSARQDPELLSLLQDLSPDSPVAIRVVDQKALSGYEMLYDIYGNPAVLMRLDMPRVVFRQGQAALSYFIWALLAFTVIFSCVSVFLLEKLVLSRLALLNNEVRHIEESGDISTRVSAKGGDEITSLARTINGMLAVLEQSKEALRRTSDELEVRVEERTVALARTNQELQTEIVEHARAETALSQSEERYALAARGSNDGIWDIDLQANQVYYSPRWKSMLGYCEGEISDSWDEWLNRIHADDLQRAKNEFHLHLTGALPQFESEHRIQHKDGHYLWVQARGIAVRNGDGQATRMAGSLTDITSRKTIEEQLQHDAMHDLLTKLANRTYFMAQLKRSVDHSRRRPDFLAAALLLDLDRFKLINDSLGHHIGDRLLVAIARRLEGCLRPGDTIARMGGDEFAILLEDIHQVSDAIRVARRIQEELVQPFSLEDHEIFTSVSIGIALTNAGYTNPDEMLRDADTAMYRAKAKGKARHEIFDKEMHAQSVGQLQLEAELRRAVERREFTVYYQPLVSLVDGRITRVEALTRWQHPLRGLVPPKDFIPLAEETGLIVPVGAWVLETACRQAKQWHDSGYPDLGVAVNIAAAQLQDPHFDSLVAHILEETGLPAHALELEITENTAMQDVERSYKVLRDLRSLGVGISIDDFGISYSSLGYLKRFPVTTLKIDRSFIADIDSDSDSAAIVKAILAMGRVLKLRVVAEGVEEASQMNWLASQFCDEAQGFLVSPAVPAEKITGLIQQVSVTFQPA